MFIPILFTVLMIALVLGLILSPSFRTGVANAITNVVEIVFGVARIYALAVGAAIISMTLLVFIALMIGSPVLSGIVFLFAIVVFFILWLPLGVVLKLFNATPAVVPIGVRSFFAWLAFVGFLAMMTPDIFTMKTTLIAALLAIFFAMIPARFNSLEKLVMPLIIIMCLIGAWKIISPDNFRSFRRHGNATGGVITTWNDRRSFTKEANSSSTFARLEQDAKVVYTATIDNDQITSLTPVAMDLKFGTIFLLCNQKEETKIFQGQAFTKIQFSNEQGSYVNGNCFWIEANLLKVGTLDDVRISKKPGDCSPVGERLVALGPGTHTLILAPGEVVHLKTYPSRDGCNLLTMSSPTFNYQYKFGQQRWSPDGNGIIYPYMKQPECLLCSKTGDTLTIMVA